MSFAISHIVEHLGELYKSREETGDFTLNCEGKAIKAHSLILSMRLVFQYMRGELFSYSQVRVFQDSIEYGCWEQQQDNGCEGVLL